MQTVGQNPPQHKDPIPAHVWRAVSRVVGDASGAAMRAELARLKNRHAAAAIARALARARIARAGVGPIVIAPVPLRERRLAALGVALALLAQPNRRRDHWRGGVVRGVPRVALCGLLRAPSGEAPAVAALAGERGYLRQLEDVGAVYRLQPSVRLVEPFERGASGFAINRYWVIGSTPAPRARRRGQRG